jgi:hypothetical protein
LAGNAIASARLRCAIAERLWRVRKDHRIVDAIVRAGAGGEGVSLTIDYNGEAAYSCRLPSHDLAVREAGDRLHDFLRQGWSTHW